MRGEEDESKEPCGSKAAAEQAQQHTPSRAFFFHIINIVNTHLLVPANAVAATEIRMNTGSALGLARQLRQRVRLGGHD